MKKTTRILLVAISLFASVQAIAISWSDHLTNYGFNFTFNPTKNNPQQFNFTDMPSKFNYFLHCSLDEFSPAADLTIQDNNFQRTYSMYRKSDENQGIVDKLNPIAGAVDLIFKSDSDGPGECSIIVTKP